MPHTFRNDNLGDDTTLFDSTRLPAPEHGSPTEGSTPLPVTLYRQLLKDAQEELFRRFDAGNDIRQLVRARAWVVDQVLSDIWRRLGLAHRLDVALIAVGGYGRGELHPNSDIDILVLLANNNIEVMQATIEQFITVLWDLGLDVGSSVRTIEECVQAAGDDITIATNLMESRTIIGPAELRERMAECTGPTHVWPGQEFFKAKWDEQIARHHKHNNTEYNLEPDLKNAPGGLRDIQMIGWVAKRHFDVRTLHELVDRGFLTEKEFAVLDEGQAFLWRIRFALHRLAKRGENRILFDFQKTLAAQFGYTDNHDNQAVGQFMKDYFRVALSLSELNDILLQYFDEAILHADEPEVITPINSRFQLRNGFIEVTSPHVFKRTPSALLELFLLMSQDDNIEDIRASTIRLLLESQYLIDDKFRHDIRSTSLFVELLRSPHQLFSTLRRMKRYGILGRYIPAFGLIVGQMQYDLFHIYTVDAHTLLVLKNMRRFRYREVEEKFPVVARVAQNLPKIELLYLAGLFHDIAKGRGGDHSEQGSADAEEFCRLHRFGTWDTHLVCWLVRNHLLMSVTAQKKDVSDPDVIQEFANVVGDPAHLDYLYAMTVADICATNPTLWNSWRASLLRQLYTETRRALRRGLGNPIDKSSYIEQIRNDTWSILRKFDVDKTRTHDFWDKLGDDYFLRDSPADIAWHTLAILQHEGNRPLVLLRETSEGQFSGCTMIFVYAPDQANLFAATVAALAQLHLTVLDARIITSSDHFSLDTWIVLEEDGQPIGDNQDRIQEIQQVLTETLANPGEFPKLVKRKLSRKVRHFMSPTRVRISDDSRQPRTVVEVRAADRPGLLAEIGRLFMEFNLNLQNARIATLGEIAEDVFFVTDSSGGPLTDSNQRELLARAICTALDQHE